MAIDRGPWNALVDDDGSNLIGSVWNKDQIKTVLLDPIDAEIAAAVGGIVVPPGTETLVTSTATGTVNDWAPGLVGHTTVVWTGTAALTITGIAGGVSGQRVTIKNRGTAAISLAHASAGSAAANRLTNMATSAPTPIAPDGVAIYVYQTGAGWMLIGHEQGAWITPPFSAADYSSFGAQTWTVEAADVVTCLYHVAGRSLDVLLSLQNTTVSGGHPALTVRIPGGFLHSGLTLFVPTVAAKDGTNPKGTGMAALNPAYTHLLLVYKDSTGGTNWSAATNTTVIDAAFRFPIT